MITSYGLAFLAGLLSVLSPCVLPLVPIVLGAAASKHPLGPFALITGVTTSFVAIGLFVAALGFAIGFDSDLFRRAAAVLLIGAGVTLIVPWVQTQLAIAASPMSSQAHARFDALNPPGLFGQFVLGILLGAVWAPCVGPTLGAASILASRGESLPSVAITMFAFGLGATIPLVVLGALSRSLIGIWSPRLRRASRLGKIGLGLLLVSVGVAVLTGLDRNIETTLVEVSPDWLTKLTTRY